MPTEPTPRPTRRFLRCARCGRTCVESLAELLAFTRTSWPRCCGDVMALAAEPDPDDPTPLQRPVPAWNRDRRSA
jgi:hypothetical protein